MSDTLLNYQIRRAEPHEAPILSEVAFRSKAHWGYDAAFMAACRDDLTLSPQAVATHPYFVAEQAGQIVGFGSLTPHGDEVELTNLFVLPEAIGRGYGKALWQHAVQTARALGFRTLIIHSDPHAEAFYRAMGAEQIGVRESGVFAGRMLPLLRFRF